MPARASTHPSPSYDLIVVGAGLAGSECAWHCAEHGYNVLLITTSLDTVGNLFEAQLPVAQPPADSLMQHLAPQGGLSSWHYHRALKGALESHAAIHLLQSSVTDMVMHEGKLQGVETWEGIQRYSCHVALCVGTFLGARLQVGDLCETAGRWGEMAYDALHTNLQAHAIAFCKQQLSVPEHAPAYQLHYHQLCLEAWQENTCQVSQLPGLYAAGACTPATIPAGMPHPFATVQQGQALAHALRAKLTLH